MPKGKILNDEEKGQIKAYKTMGWSNRKIALQIGRSSNCVNNFVNEEKNPTRKKTPGPKNKLSLRQKSMILRESSKNGSSIANIKSQLQLNVSRETVRRVLKSSPNMNYVKLARTPPLNPLSKSKRLTFARIHQTWNQEWQNVVWSDEKKWNLDGPDSCARIWHDNRRKKPVLMKRHTGGGSLMVWGAFSFHGKSNLTTITTSQNSAEYQSHLRDTLLPVWQELSRENGILMQDNARCHVSRDSMDWLRTQNIPTMNWPPYSPDLNPIENIWGILSNKVYGQGKQYKSIAELKAAVFLAWDELDLNLLQTLSMSMPKRIFELILAQGGHIKY